MDSSLPSPSALLVDRQSCGFPHVPSSFYEWDQVSQDLVGLYPQYWTAMGITLFLSTSYSSQPSFCRTGLPMRTWDLCPMTPVSSGQPNLTGTVGPGPSSSACCPRTDRHLMPVMTAIRPGNAAFGRNQPNRLLQTQPAGQPIHPNNTFWQDNRGPCPWKL